MVPKALVIILSHSIVILQPADWDKITNTDVSYLKFLQQCCFCMVSLFGLLGFPILLLGWISVHRTHLEKAVCGRLKEILISNAERHFLHLQVCFAWFSFSKNAYVPVLKRNHQTAWRQWHHKQGGRTSKLNLKPSMPHTCPLCATPLQPL